ncbi:glycerophosphodiester phosphodiesterase family protein [Microbacterium sp. gxy059]|uniref:glycerophosphodiester phosphodiesterase family protein n=1 Tax=Microbacterium sp. gxy059 TaxID=2957199 RepID=UPI003D958977
MPTPEHPRGSAPHPFFRDAEGTRVLAHRGLVTDEMRADGIAENTVAAFAAADAAGVVFAESDCHLTADGEVVLFHDANLERVTGDPRDVADVPLRELEDMMAERGGLTTLEQALEAFPDLRFNIDVKAEGAAEPTGRIAAPHAHRVLLTSFSDRRRLAALAAARREGGAPATSAGMGTVARVLALASVGRSAHAARLLRDVDALQIPERQKGLPVLTRRLLEAAHGAGTEVHVWTVNEPSDMSRLLARGVDGIVTDRADVAHDVLS